MRGRMSTLAGAAAAVLIAAPGLAQAAGPESVDPAAILSQPVVSPDAATRSASEREWHERFTFAGESALGDLRFIDGLAPADDMMDIPAGESWGFTIGVNSNSETALDLDGVRAGAFIDVNARLRIGGEVFSYSSPDEVFTPGDRTREERAVKLETEFKF